MVEYITLVYGFAYIFSAAVVAIILIWSFIGMIGMAMNGISAGLKKLREKLEHVQETRATKKEEKKAQKVAEFQLEEMKLSETPT
jgi:uncharacterized oligopeptide transporter (OPT) family protein